MLAAIAVTVLALASGAAATTTAPAAHASPSVTTTGPNGTLAHGTGPDKAGAPDPSPPAIPPVLVAGLPSVFAAGVVGGLAVDVPALAGSHVRRAQASAVAAGVLLAAACVHMWGDAQEDLGSIDFPVAGTLFAGTFLGMLALSRALGHGHGDDHGAVGAHDVHGGGDAAGVGTGGLTGSLSVHSILMGISLGVAAASPNTATALGVLAAILAHKSLAAFTIALAWSRRGASRCRRMAVIVPFSTLTPAGMAAGFALGEALPRPRAPSPPWRRARCCTWP